MFSDKPLSSLSTRSIETNRGNNMKKFIILSEKNLLVT